jgi:hypothetical protein
VAKINLTERVFKSVGRHFVTLSCVRRIAGQPEKAFVFSGFLVEAGGAWFYVTAGHITRDIRTALAQGATFHHWRLDDQTAGNAFKAAIPYDFEIRDWLELVNDENGLDYAATPLRENYRQLLKAGKALPITKGSWGHDQIEHDYWVMIGMPSESVEYDQKTFIRGRITFIPLKEVQAPPGAGAKAQNQFYAQLAEDAKVKDVDGMSGGPIFSIRRMKGEWRYHIIGVQSAFYRDARVIAACPFVTFGNELDRLVAMARAKLKAIKQLPKHTNEKKRTDTKAKRQRR